LAIALFAVNADVALERSRLIAAPRNDGNIAGRRRIDKRGGPAYRRGRTFTGKGAVMAELLEILRLIGLFALWAAMSLALLPLAPFAAPALIEWYGARAAAPDDAIA